MSLKKFNSFLVWGIILSLFFSYIPIQDNLVFAEHLDISQVVGEKYSLQVDEQTFVIYYGYGGSLESIREGDDPQVISMSINSDHKSLEINLEETSATHVMWIRLQPELISAEGEKFQVLIDGVEKGYDLTKYPNDMAVGYILPEGSQHVEIIGTHVIPEFGEISLVVFTISLFSVIYFCKKKSELN